MSSVATSPAEPPARASDGRGRYDTIGPSSSQWLTVSRPLPWVEPAGRWLGVAAAAVGAIALVGWLADVPILRQVLPALPPMMPATAVSVILTGMGLALLGKRRGRVVACALATAIALIGLVAIAQQLAGVRDTIGIFTPARMATQAAVALLLLAIALAEASGRRATTGGVFAVAAGGIGYLSLLGLLNGSSTLEQFTPRGQVSLPTAVAIMLLAAGLLFRTADRGIGRIVSDPQPVGMVVRGGLILFVALPILSAGVITAEASGMLSPTAAGVAPSLGIVTFVAGVVGWTAARVAQWDRARSVAAALTAADRDRVRALLDALPGQIGLVSPSGRLLAVNRAWDESAVSNGPCERCDLGENYLAALDRADGESSPDAAAGLRAVLAGAAPRFVADHPTPALGGRQWFRMIAGPFHDGSVGGAVVMHLDVTDEVAAAQARRVSDERFRLLVESSPNAVAVIDTSNRASFINPACEKLFGYTLAEYHADPHLARNLVAEEFRPKFDAVWEWYAANGEFPEWVHDWPWRTKSGRWIEVEHRIINIRDGAGVVAGFLTISRDVTAERRAERALQASKEMLLEVGRVARVGGWELDITTRLTIWSEEVRRIHEVDEGAGLTVSQTLAFYPEPGRTQLAGALREAIRAGEPFDLKLPFVTAGGRRLWVRVTGLTEGRPDGTLARLYGSFQDITPFHDAEDALRASEQRFRALVEKSTDGIALLDTEARFQYLSPSVRDMLGYPPDELLGKSIADFLHPDDLKAAKAQFTAALAAGGKPVACRLRYRHADGSYRAIAGVKSDRRDDPAVRAVVANFHDVTEREQLEEQLRQAQKMDAVGRLAGGVAHDFNNMLTVILGFGDMALAGLAQTDPVRDWVDQMVLAGRRAADLTRQLLAFSRKQVTRPKVIDLGTVVAGTEKMLRRVIGEDVALTIESPPGLWPVKADPGQVEQVVMNLTVNARDAMPGGGSVVLRIGNLPADHLPADTPTDAVRGEYVVLTVSDTGCGMDEATRARVFEPFFTTKGPDRGTGLGLATVYGIARQAGGFVTAESSLGVGSTFRVYLPRTFESSGHSDIVFPAEAGGYGRETVLLVEDDDSVRTLARFTLQRHGYRVIEAQNGHQAMAALDGVATSIQLLVTDVVMPGMSGPEVAERVTRAKPGVRVLFLSGYPKDHIGRGGVMDDETAFLQKPFLPDVLARKVREVLDAPEVR